MFKESFKYYKSKNPPPRMTNVLDLNKSEELLAQKQIKKFHIENLEYCHKSKGLKSAKYWNAFEFVQRPGLIVIKNPLTSIGQRYWTIRCLQDYSRTPNKRNIDTLNILPEGSEWWDTAQKNNVALKKLRWATLGYHHNWDTKVYSEDNKGEFPQDLCDLTKDVANCFGYTAFNPESAIVNYYHMDSTLSGHTDHSEQFLEAPLFSLSLGQTAIFLIGGNTIEEKPLAILLRSGDIVIMSKESRLAYHGVPKILEADVQPWDYSDETEEDLNNDMHFLEMRTYGNPLKSTYRVTELILTSDRFFIEDTNICLEKKIKE